MTEDRQIRKLRLGLIATALAGLASVVGVAIAWRIDTDNRRAQSCEGQVQKRLDERAMWDYLLATNDDPTNPRAIAFTVELNNRLPLLKCERGSAVPIPENP